MIRKVISSLLRKLCSNNFLDLKLTCTFSEWKKYYPCHFFTFPHQLMLGYFGKMLTVLVFLNIVLGIVGDNKIYEVSEEGWGGGSYTIRKNRITKKRNVVWASSFTPFGRVQSGIEMIHDIHFKTYSNLFGHFKLPLC